MKQSKAMNTYSKVGLAEILTCKQLVLYGKPRPIGKQYTFFQVFNSKEATNFANCVEYDNGPEHVTCHCLDQGNGSETSLHPNCQIKVSY